MAHMSARLFARPNRAGRPASKAAQSPKRASRPLAELANIMNQDFSPPPSRLEKGHWQLAHDCEPPQPVSWLVGASRWPLTSSGASPEWRLLDPAGPNWAPAARPAVNRGQLLARSHYARKGPLSPLRAPS